MVAQVQNVRNMAVLSAASAALGAVLPTAFNVIGNVFHRMSQEMGKKKSLVEAAGQVFSNPKQVFAQRIQAVEMFAEIRKIVPDHIIPAGQELTVQSIADVIIKFHDQVNGLAEVHGAINDHSCKIMINAPDSAKAVINSYGMGYPLTLSFDNTQNIQTLTSLVSGSGNMANDIATFRRQLEVCNKHVKEKEGLAAQYHNETIVLGQQSVDYLNKVTACMADTIEIINSYNAQIHTLTVQVTKYESELNTCKHDNNKLNAEKSTCEKELQKKWF